MAAPSLSLSTPGAINGDTGTWDKDNALFLKVFSGEVLTSFKRTNIFEGLVQTRTIQNGRSAQFPVTGRFTAKYHTPGEMTACKKPKLITTSARSIRPSWVKHWPVSMTSVWLAPLHLALALPPLT